jgi:LCP family protein required for cell wall assembly
MVAAGGTIVAGRVIFAAATSSVQQQNLLGEAGNQAVTSGHVTIVGAKTILLVGVDSRPGQNPQDLVRSDSIIVAHITAAHDAAYLVSIPRDTWVQIPAYDNGKRRYAGGPNRINAAYAFGGDGLTGADARTHAVELLAKTIKAAYGVSFDAAAIVDFTGFQDVVNVLGGVDMYVDQETTSVHRGTTKDGKQKIPFRQYQNADGSTRLVPVSGVTPQVYHVGYQHLEPWQALDYVRQRETLPNSDYDRERHQQQFIKAIIKQATSRQVLTNPVKLAEVLSVIGKAMTVDRGGIALEDWVYAMRNISADGVVALKTNNGTFHTARNGSEQLDPATLGLLAAVGSDTVQEYVTAHPELIIPAAQQ